MFRSSLFLAPVLIGANFVLVQTVVIAKSAVEVGRIAKSITVEIKQVGVDKVGSGILLQRQRNVYTVLTAGHVINSGDGFLLTTSDGRIHQAVAGSVRLSGTNLDLAVLKFRSDNNYPLAKIGTSRSLEIGFPVYVAGFPKATKTIEAGTFNSTKGEVIGIANKGNSSGYSLIYSNITFKGMSGGPVLNEAGELVAIHGQGDRDDSNDGVSGEGEKTGRNLGIVVERFSTVALAMGVQLDQPIAAIPNSQILNASDYFLRGLGKYKQGDYQGALGDYNQAIIIDPKFSKAYYNRGNLKAKKLNDIKGALNDFNQAISLNPRYAYAYHSRAILKWEQLNDIQGALADYNQTIFIDPKIPQAYYNRGNLKYGEAGLNDPQGALADLNKAISLDPEYANAYDSRARLKNDELNDKTGAIRDFRNAARLYRAQGKTQELLSVLDQLRELKASE